MENWKVQLNAGRWTLDKMKMQKGILQGDDFSQQLFVTAMIPLSFIIQRFSHDYKMSEGNITAPSIYMEDI